MVKAASACQASGKRTQIPALSGKHGGGDVLCFSTTASQSLEWQRGDIVRRDRGTDIAFKSNPERSDCEGKMF